MDGWMDGWKSYWALVSV